MVLSVHGLRVMGLIVALALPLGCLDSETTAMVRAQVEPMPVRVRERADEEERRLRRSACSDAKTVADAAQEYLRKYRKCPSDPDALEGDFLLMNAVEYHPRWSFECTESGVIVSEPGLDARVGTDDDVVFGGPHATCRR